MLTTVLFRTTFIRVPSEMNTGFKPFKAFGTSNSVIEMAVFLGGGGGGLGLVGGNNVYHPF